MAEINIILPTRDDISQDWRNAWEARAKQQDPDRVVDVGRGTLPYLAGEVVADVIIPLYSNDAKLLRGMVVRGKTGTMLEDYAKEFLSLNDDGSVRLPATGGSGYMEATKIAVGGAYIVQGTVVLHQSTGYRYQVAVSNTYEDGDPIPIVGIDTGPDTNLDADEPLIFSSPPPGVSTGGAVLAQNDGTGVLVGLLGGREAETDTELQDRVIEAQSEPPAAGNSAQIVQQAQKTGGVPVQKAFAISAWFGPGSICVPFLLRPDAGVTRIPNSTQRGLVQANLQSVFPTDYSITVPTIISQPVEIAIGVSWVSGARGWTDITPWPEHVPGDPVIVDGAMPISSTAFRATTGTATSAPPVGQTIALFDILTKRFMRKRIATVTEVVAGESWDLTFTTQNGASDTFIPEAGALLSPYSQSLVRLIAPLITYVRTLGPGEQFSTFPDPGGRQKRWPFSPEAWPNIITNDGLVNAMKASGATSDAEVLSPNVPYATTVGTPGATVYLLELGDFAVFPQT